MQGPLRKARNEIRPRKCLGIQEYLEEYPPWGGKFNISLIFFQPRS